MKALLLVAALPALALATTAGAAPREARCILAGGGLSQYSGPCLFEPGPRGSFTLSPAAGRRFPGGVSSVTLSVTAPGTGEVRGLTRDGINSRWGRAVRSRTDPACWVGEDFSICAY